MNKRLQNPGPTWEFDSRSEADTEALGAALADALEPGIVVSLVGDLGAGKTRLVQAVGRRLGVDERAVSSPTFVLHQEYSGTQQLHHFDAYRLRDSDEFLEIGGPELIESQAVSFIEWGDRLADVLPRDVLRIEIDVTGPNERRMKFTGSGPRSSAVIARLASRG